MKSTLPEPARSNRRAAALAAPRGPSGWADRGRLLARGGDLLGALRSLQRSLECDSDCYEAWLGLSEIFTAMRDVPRAVRSLAVARRIRARCHLSTSVFLTRAGGVC